MREPVPEVVAHVVAAEGQHGHGVAADLADGAAGGGGGFRAHGGADVDAGGPVEGLVDERHGGGAAAAEDEGGDGDAVRGLPRSGSMVGHCEAGAVKRPLGWAAGLPVSCRFRASRGCRASRGIAAGGVSVMPSHQTPGRSGVSATLVKMVLRASVAMALGLVLALVPGATPKKPASGLMARSWPVASGLIQAMSSPTVQTFQPSKPAGGISMAKLVLPQAEGKAAAT